MVSPSCPLPKFEIGDGDRSVEFLNPHCPRSQVAEKCPLFSGRQTVLRYSNCIAENGKRILRSAPLSLISATWNLKMSSTFPGFSSDALSFLRNLKRNNRRDWFQPRKQLYETFIK